MNNNYYQVENAIAKWHNGQTRDNGVDYFRGHILPVKDLVIQATADLGIGEDAHLRFVYTALAHDVLEDTACGIKDLYDLIEDDEVVNGVISLTNIKGESPQEWQHRMSSLGSVAALVKLCDRYHNLTDSLNPSSGWAPKRIKAYAAKARQIDEATAHHWENQNRQSSLWDFVKMYRRLYQIIL